eukprot:XP_017948034.1 PREDICTED: uncharacterized protein LOC101733240 isoform X1 [Xenopus tropicalis]
MYLLFYSPFPLPFPPSPLTIPPITFILYSTHAPHIIAPVLLHLYVRSPYSNNVSLSTDYVVVDKEEILRAMHSRKMHRFDRTTTESPKIETTVGKCHYPCTYCPTLLSLCPSRPPHLLSLLSLLFSIVPTPLTLLLLFFSLLHLYVRAPYSNNVSLSTDYVVVDKEEILRAMHSRGLNIFDRTTKSPKFKTTTVDFSELLKGIDEESERPLPRMYGLLLGFIGFVVFGFSALMCIQPYAFWKTGHLGEDEEDSEEEAGIKEEEEEEEEDENKICNIEVSEEAAEAAEDMES